MCLRWAKCHHMCIPELVPIRAFIDVFACAFRLLAFGFRNIIQVDAKVSKVSEILTKWILRLLKWTKYSLNKH